MKQRLWAGIKLFFLNPRSRIRFNQLSICLFLFFFAQCSSSFELGTTNPGVYWILTQLNAEIDPVDYLSSTNIEPELYEPTPRDFLQVRHMQIWIETDTPGDRRLAKHFRDIGISIFQPETIHNIWDPHFWLSPSMMGQLTKELYNYLRVHDPIHQLKYMHNYQNTIRIIDRISSDLNSQFKNSRLSKHEIIIIHPSLSFFCKEFNLIQIPIALEGGEPGLKEILAIREEIAKKQITTIFVEPQFSSRSVFEVMGDDHKVKLVSLNTLDTDWPRMMYSIASKVHESLR